MVNNTVVLRALKEFHKAAVQKKGTRELGGVLTMSSSVLKLLRSNGKFSLVTSVIKSCSSRTFASKVSFSFIESKTGNKVVVTGEIGKTVLDVAVAHDIDIEGACGGELACSTCHVIVKKELFDRLPKKKEEEDDMLDLAWGLKDT